MEMPKFDIKDPGFTEAEYEESLKPKSGSLQPGRYTMRIISAELSNQNKTDPTWYSYKLKFEHGGKTIPYVIMVPTKTAKFNKPGIKNNLFLYRKFKEFAESLGYECTRNTLSKTAPTLFADPSVLVGKEVDVTVGYPGYYVARDESGGFKIYQRDGKEATLGEENPTFPDRDAAILEAATMYNIIVKKFVEILQFHKIEDDNDDSLFGV